MKLGICPVFVVALTERQGASFSESAPKLGDFVESASALCEGAEKAEASERTQVVIRRFHAVTSGLGRFLASDALTLGRELEDDQSWRRERHRRGIMSAVCVGQRPEPTLSSCESGPGPGLTGRSAERRIDSGMGGAKMLKGEACRRRYMLVGA